MSKALAGCALGLLVASVPGCDIRGPGSKAGIEQATARAEARTRAAEDRTDPVPAPGAPVAPGAGTDLPDGVPGGIPDGISDGMPAELPDAVPVELPDAVPVELPDAVPLQPIGIWTPAPWLEGAQRVAALEAHGLVVAAGPGWLRVYQPDGTVLAESSDTGKGAAQVLETLDVDGDGREEIAIARGLGRDVPDAPASLAFFAYDRERGLSAPASVRLPPTTRAQVIGVVADPARPGHVWVGTFDSQYMVTVLDAHRSGSGPGARPDAWTTRVVERVRMPMAMAAGDVDGDGRTELLLARPYGESAGTPGDVLVLRPGTALPAASGDQGGGQAGAGMARVPTTGGARAVIAVGRDVLYADGWHREYGSRARALITAARWQQGAWTTQVLAHVRGRRGYERLRVGDVDGDGVLDVVASGDGPAVLVPSSRPVTGSVPSLGSAEAWDAYPVDLNDDQQHEVIILGPYPGIWQDGDAG